MSKDIVEKLIKLNNEACPELTFSNPLLDRNVTSALSKSLVKILWPSKNGTGETRVRASVLQTIRDLCRTAQDGHVEIDEDLTEVLTSCYEMQLTKSTGTKNINKQLDAFLIQNLKSMNVRTSFESSLNPEVLQAMLNLNKSVVFSEIITKDYIHWNVDDDKSRCVLQNLWTNVNSMDKDLKHNTCLYDSVSIKIKSKIESVLLNILHRLLKNEITTDTLFSENELSSLVSSCSISPECFQICTCILNSLFLETNFNTCIEEFIFLFIQAVKENAKSLYISTLYPIGLNNLVMILDLNLHSLLNLEKQKYTHFAIDHLKSLHEKSEYDLIMLLTHFPSWFNIYFDN